MSAIKRGTIYNERYELESKLSQNNISETWNAKDLQTEKLCRLNIIELNKNKFPLEAVLRFQVESESQKSLKHVGLPKFLDYIDQENIIGIITEDKSYQNLQHYLKQNDTLSLDQILQILSKISLAIQYVHEQKLLFNNLKTSNILLNKTNEINIQILDVGYSHLLEQQQNRSTDILAYMSPEMTGLLKKTIDHRSDLYSLGIIAYELLTGRLPFKTKDPDILTHMQLANIPPRPSKYRSEIPPVFEKMILKLLSKDPTDRYQSAGGFGRDIERLKRNLTNKTLKPINFTIGSEDHFASFPSENPFTGRTKLLSKIEEVIVSNSSKIISIEGARGIGKSSLLREIYNKRSVHKTNKVFYYKPQYTEKPLSLSGLRGLLENFVAHVQSHKSSEQKAALLHIQKKLGSHYSDLLELLPNIELLNTKHKIKLKKSSKGEIVEVCSKLIKLNHNKEEQQIIIIDDFQNLDFQSAKIILETFQGIHKGYACLIYTYNRELISPKIKKLQSKEASKSTLTEFSLGPLDKTELLLLLHKLFAHSLVELSSLLQSLANFTGGNPRKLRQILQTLIDTQAIFYSNHNWQCSLDKSLKIISEQYNSSSFDILKDLEKNEIELLKIASIFQRSFSVKAIHAIKENNASLIKKPQSKQIVYAEILSTFDKARSLGILTISSNELYSFRNHTLRATLHDSIPHERKQLLHRYVAFYLKRNILQFSPTTIYDIAWHYELANEHLKATYAYLKVASLYDDHNFRNQEALIYYNLAADKVRAGLVPNMSHKKQFKTLFFATYHSYSLNPGNMDFDRDIKILESYSDSEEECKILLLTIQAGASFLQGNRTTMVKQAELCVELIEKAIIDKSKNDYDFYLLDCLTLLGIIPSKKSYEQRATLLEKVITISLKKEYFTDINRVLTVLTIMLSYTGRFSVAQNWISKTKKALLKSTNQKFRNRTLGAEGMLAIESGNFKLFEKLEDQVSSIYQEMNPLARNFIMAHSARVYAINGNFKQSALLLEQMQSKILNTRTQGVGPLTLFGQLVLANRMEDPEKALEVYEKAKYLLKQRPDPYKVIEFDIEASLAYIALKNLDAAQKILNQALIMAKKLGSILLDAHLEFALNRLEWKIHKKKQYVNNAEKAIEKLEQMGATGYAKIYNNELETWNKQEVATSTLAGTSREGKELFQLIEITQKISSMLDSDLLLKEVLQGAMRMTGAQHGYLFLIDSETTKTTSPILAIDSDGKILKKKNYIYSKEILENCLTFNKSIISRDAQKEIKWNKYDSITKNKLRSILAVPVLYQGSLIGVLYLDNHIASSVFSNRDKGIVEHFAIQAAIAIYNARLFEKEKKARKQTEVTLLMFEKFIPRNFTDRFAEGKVELLKSGLSHEEHLTVLFSDIRNFTGLSESITVKELFLILNDYLKFMEMPIRQHKGFVDKYIGDAIMAIFDRDPFDAIEAAIGMQRALTKLNHLRKKKGLQTLATGIGINCGNTMIGVIGSRERIDTTVMGDTVNAASRIEGLSKTYNTEILIGEPVFDQIRHRENLNVRFIDRVQTIGKQEHMNIYEVFNHQPDSVRQKKIELMQNFESCFQIYTSGNWKNAIEAFSDYTNEFPSDKVALTLLDRSKRFLHSPPADWNGIYHQENK